MQMSLQTEKIYNVDNNEAQQNKPEATGVGKTVQRANFPAVNTFGTNLDCNQLKSSKAFSLASFEYDRKNWGSCHLCHLVPSPDETAFNESDELARNISNNCRKFCFHFWQDHSNTNYRWDGEKWKETSSPSRSIPWNYSRLTPLPSRKRHFSPNGSVSFQNLSLYNFKRFDTNIMITWYQTQTNPDILSNAILSQKCRST